MGPTTGVFTLGIVFPWANSWVNFGHYKTMRTDYLNVCIINTHQGAFLGVVSSYAFTGLLVIGSSIAGMNKQLPDQTLPISTENCSAYLSGDELENIKHLNHSYAPGFDWKSRHEDDSAYIKLVSTSYLLFHGIGLLGTVFFGLIFSAIIKLVKLDNDSPVRLECLNEHFLKFWKVLFPKQIQKLVQAEDKNKISQIDTNLNETLGQRDGNANKLENDLAINS